MIRSVNYFANAGGDPDPEALDGMTWEEAKEIVKEAIHNNYNK